MPCLGQTTAGTLALIPGAITQAWGATMALVGNGALVGIGFHNIQNAREGLSFMAKGEDVPFKGTNALRRHNEVVRHLVDKYGLNKDQQQQLHRALRGEQLEKEEIDNLIRQMFPKLFD